METWPGAESESELAGEAEISLAEAQAKIPVMAVDDLDSAFFIPGDGMTNPTDTTQALARGARRGGGARASPAAPSSFPQAAL